MGFFYGFVSTVIYCFTPSNSWPLNWKNRSINPWVLVVGSMFGQWPQEHPRMSGVKRATWPIFGAEETFLPNIKYTPPSPGLALDLLWFYYLFILRVFGTYSMGWLDGWVEQPTSVFFLGSRTASIASHICWLYHISFCVSSLFLGNVLIFWWTIHQIQFENFHFGHTYIQYICTNHQSRTCK